MIKRRKVLLCKRPVGVPYAGRWEFPSVLLEGDETAEDALERDFFERLGWKVLKSEPKGAADVRECPGCRMLYYELETDRHFVSRLELTGYADSRWVSLSRMGRYPLMSQCVTYIKSQKFYPKFS